MIGKNLSATTKRDIARQAARAVGISIEDAEKTINVALEMIKRTVGAGGKVELRRFGVFRPKHIRERICAGVNPQTGKPVHIKNSVRLNFKPARSLHSLRIGDNQ
jgi:nucleoid DNA-binding protein